MKSDAVFALQNAGWPVFLLDESGLISDANDVAFLSFGNTLLQQPTHLANFWAAENEISTQEFMSRVTVSNTLPPIKLKNVGDTSVAYNPCASPLEKNQAKTFLLQLLPPIPGQSKSSGADFNFFQKQKLDCALQLARTVSLDFNNALASILGHTSLILSRMEADNPWRYSLMQVEKSAAKAAEIANDLGTFSRQEKGAKMQQPGDLNLLAQRNIEIFQSAGLERQITWALQLERKLNVVRVDEAKIQQAMVKVMENAVESLGSHGSITVRTRNLEVTQPTQDRDVHLAPGTYVCLEIIDSGAGIAADVLSHVFEPFFTTKRGAKHRGLGLTWVYGIVTNHGGGVALSSQPDVGTSVRIYLPADNKIIKESPTGLDLHGNETILMVDDEDLVLTMGQTILANYGYNVLIANGGMKALEIINQAGQPIDLLLTDLVMPGMSGRELVEQVRQVSPHTQIICTSGYVQPNTVENNTLSYLQKPFTSRDLLLKIRQSLAQVEAPSVDS